MFQVIQAETYLADLEVTPIIFDVDLRHATSGPLVHLHGLDAILCQYETPNRGLSVQKKGALKGRDPALPPVFLQKQA